MSALEEYQRVSALGGYLPSEEAIIERADAAIAELEAEIRAKNAQLTAGFRDEAAAANGTLQNRVWAIEAENKRLRSITVKGVPAGVDYGLYYDRFLAAEAELAEAILMRDVARDNQAVFATEAKEALAELAALNARRCDGCRDWHEDIRGADIGTCWLGVSSTNSDETTCADFSCNRWAARTEEGSGE